MAKWHYVIVSKDRAKIEDNGDSKKVVIDKSIEIYENKRRMFPIYDFDTGKTDHIFNLLIGLACLNLLVMIIAIVIGHDFEHNTAAIFLLGSDIVAGAGLFITFVSFRRIKLSITKHFFKFGLVGNVLFFIFYSLILALFLAALLYYIGLSSTFANLISLVVLLISMLKYRSQ